MAGSDVMKTQKMLRQLGYYHGTADGIFGGYLKQAVMKFQRDSKLKADGVVGRRTYDEICAQSKALKYQTDKPET